MKDLRALITARDAILADWIARLSEHRVLMGSREAIAAELSHWLTHLAPAIEQDAATAHELYKLIAFHARQLGLEGRPASAVLTQLLDLDDAIVAQLGPLPEAVQVVLREMMRVATDAHALGQSERLNAGHRQRLREASPIIHLDSNVVIGFLLGPMDPANIDGMFGRVLRESLRLAARVAVIDLFGADEPDDRLHRTVEGFLSSDAGKRLTLNLTGVADIDAMKLALETVGADITRVRVYGNIQDYLAQRATARSSQT